MSDNSSNDIFAKVWTMSEMVAYQPGSVVSRTVMEEKEKGTITLFAFSEGQGLSEHTAPFDALAYIMDGEAEVSIASDTHSLTKGQMIILPANIPHALQATKQFKMLLVMIKKA